ncbi:MAG: O-antigen ligase family protein [Gammaproteobacteria bacterium]|nr:O-antigen ligase family protein [Gammaproteobacteria bacterium]
MLNAVNVNARAVESNINPWLFCFLVFLPFLVLGSRVSSDITASFSTLFLVYFWFKHPAHEIRKQRWFQVFLILWLYMCATSLLMVDPKYILGQSLIAIRWPAFALVLSSLVFKDQRKIEIFEYAALGCFVFIGLDSMLQYVTGHDIFGHIPVGVNDPSLSEYTLHTTNHVSSGLRLTGPFSKEVPGVYALRIYPIALFALLTLSHDWLKGKRAVTVFAVIIFSQVFAFLTGERIVFMSFGVINFILFIALCIQFSFSFKHILAAVVSFCGIAAASVVLAPQMINRTILSFIYGLENFKDGTYYPIIINALTLWKNNPWFGVGTRYYNQACYALPSSQRSFSPEGCALHPHQMYLEWLADNGAIGLILFLVVLYFVFKNLWLHLEFKKHPLKSALIIIPMCMVFSMIVPSMSIQSNNYGGIVWMLVGWALARASLMKDTDSKFKVL